MRLTKMITGKQIWAGKSITKRVEGSDGKLGKVIRISKPHEDGSTSPGGRTMAWALISGAWAT